MIEFKQKVQFGNRISIPSPMVQALNVKIGDEVSIFCDEEQRIVYIKFISNPVIFDRESGIIIKPYKSLTDTKFEPITKPHYKKITNQDKILVEGD